jgi:hypothetical protein
MTDLTDFLSKPPVHKTPCKFADWINSLNQDEQTAVKKAVLNPEWSLPQLAAGLKEYGLPVQVEALRKHRNGACNTCGPI